MTYVKLYIQGISSGEIKYGIFFAVLLLVVLLFLHAKKKYPIRSMFAVMVLYIILFIVFASTVFSRPDYGYYNYEMELFWSWRNVIEKQNRAMLLQIFMNMLVLIPFGFLFPIVAPGARFKHTFFFGLLCTGMIEVLQLVLQRGLFEWDDIIHNMVGVCVGYGMYRIVRTICLIRRT